MQRFFRILIGAAFITLLVQFHHLLVLVFGWLSLGTLVLMVVMAAFSDPRTPEQVAIDDLIARIRKEQDELS